MERPKLESGSPVPKKLLFFKKGGTQELDGRGLQRKGGNCTTPVAVHHVRRSLLKV